MLLCVCKELISKQLPPTNHRSVASRGDHQLCRNEQFTHIGAPLSQSCKGLRSESLRKGTEASGKTNNLKNRKQKKWRIQMETGLTYVLTQTPPTLVERDVSLFQFAALLKRMETPIQTNCFNLIK
jgi:hypothetical protein